MESNCDRYSYPFRYLYLEYWEDMSVENFLEHLTVIIIVGYLLGLSIQLCSNHRRLSSYQGRADNVRCYLNSLELPGVPRIEHLEIPRFVTGTVTLRRVVEIYEDLHLGLIEPNLTDRFLLGNLPGRYLFEVDRDLKWYFLGSIITGNHMLLLSDDIRAAADHLAWMRVAFDSMNDDPWEGMEMDKLIRLLYLDILSRATIEHLRHVITRTRLGETEVKELVWSTWYDLFLNGPFEILDRLPMNLHLIRSCLSEDTSESMVSVPMRIGRTDDSLDEDSNDHAIYPMISHLFENLNE